MAKKDFRIHDIAELYSFQKTGDVHGVSTWSETSVSAHTTHSQNGTGSTSVSSKSYEKQRFFLREAGGRENEVTLTDAEIAFRDGHRVTLIYCGHKAEQTGWVMGAFNHDTGRRAIFAGRIDWIIPKAGAPLGCLAMAVALIVPSLFIAFLPESLSILLSTAGILAAIGFMIQRGRLRKRLRGEVRAEIDRQLAEVGDRRAPPLATATPAAIGPAAA